MRSKVTGFIVGALLFLPLDTSAQTPYAEGSATQQERAGFLGALNPYVGAQIGMMIHGDDDSDPILAGNFVLLPSGWPERFPMLFSADIGEFVFKEAKNLNLSDIKKKFEDLADSRRGVVGGIYPYVPFSLGGDAEGALNFMVAGKVNKFGGAAEGETPTDDGTVATEATFLWQARVGASLELFLNGWVAGAGFVHHRFSEDTYERIFAEKKNSWSGIEAHVAVPIPDAFPVIGEYGAIYAEYIKSITNAFGDKNPGGLKVALTVRLGS